MVVSAVVTHTPVPTPILTPSPSPTTQVLVVQPSVPPAPTLAHQLGQVDPLLWAALLGVLVIPWAMELLKGLVAWAANLFSSDKVEIDDIGRRAQTALLALLSGATAFLVNTVSNGSLGKLDNPLLALVITGVIVFATGTSAYQIVYKKDQPSSTSNLPVNNNP